MKPEDLRAMQAPLKKQYKENPASAEHVLEAAGTLDSDGLVCTIDTGFGIANAGLHPATGGDGSKACSGDMLLQSLAACAGVTLTSVATAIGVELKGGTVRAEGDLDFRGTLGVSPDAQVGFTDIRLHFDLDTDADADKVAKLIDLTERYCVVYQTLKNSPGFTVSSEVK